MLTSRRDGAPEHPATARPGTRSEAGPPVASEIRFDSDRTQLAGTLLLPEGDGPLPAALLLPGSGPLDRDSDAGRLRLGITRQLAEALAAAGVASLRYDKRGVGASPGDWRRAGFHDGADDAAAALRWLVARDEVDPARVVLVGHSEGALLATVLAARGEAVAGAALLSPSATPGAELLLWQAEQIAPTLPAVVRLLLRLGRTDLRRSVAKNHARVGRTTTDVARIGGVRVNARWHREFMAYDPRPDLARITVPVLALTGSKDLQTRPADLAAVARLVRGPVRTELVDGVTHVLRHQPGRPSTGRYRREVRRPVHQGVLDAVVGWAVEVPPRTGPDRPGFVRDGHRAPDAQEAVARATAASGGASDMMVDKSKVLELLREHGDDDRLRRAEDELPEQVDTDRHGDLLASYGVDEAGLGAKSAGTGTGSGIGSGLGGNLASEPEPLVDRD